MMRFSISMVFLCAFILPMRASAQQMIVTEGKSDYSIVIPTDAIEAERTAAEELREHLSKISGVELSIIPADKFSGGKMIAVGFNKHLNSFAEKYPVDSFDEEEFIIAPCGDVLVLAGGRPRGTLYAVYEYLDNLGVRWFTSQHTFIPEKKNIELPEKAVRNKPLVQGRSYVANNGAGQQWTARNRLNEYLHWSNTGAKYGGTQRQGPDCHTFWRMIDRKRLQQNPDWCAMVDGKRELPAGTNYWGLCLTNKEVRQRLILKTLQYAEKNPDIKYIWIAQNDGSPYCTCEECSRFYDAHGGQPSSLIVSLANETAEVFARKRPGTKVKTLAYSWGQKPPKNIKVRDDVIISLCAPPAVLMSPLRTVPGATELLREWKQIANNLEIYLYSYPFEVTNCYWFPIPNLYAAADDIKWAYEEGVRYFYVYNTSPGRGNGCELIDLRSWLLPRVLSQPTADIDELVEDFCEKYYGPAAETVLKAIEITFKSGVDEKGNAKSYGHGHIMIPDYLDPMMIRKVNGLIHKQLKSMPESEYKRRLRYVWLPYLFTDFWFGFHGPGRFDSKNNTWAVELDEPEFRTQWAKIIKRIMLEQGVTAIRQLRKIHPSRLAIDMMGIDHKANALREDSTYAVVVPDVAGQIVEFGDRKTRFKPLAPCYGNRYWEYPFQGPWRDYINRHPQRNYKLIKSSPKGVELLSKRKGMEITRKVSLAGGVLHNTATVKATCSTEVQLSTQPMFNLERGVFGENPDLYIENEDGTWMKTNPGKSFSGMYLIRKIDLEGRTGRVLLASETRPQGVLVTVVPSQIENYSYEYNRHYTANVLTLMPVSAKVNLQPGQTLNLDFKVEIINDVKQWMEKSQL